jgi:hypothetical protein
MRYIIEVEQEVQSVDKSICSRKYRGRRDGESCMHSGLDRSSAFAHAGTLVANMCTLDRQGQRDPSLDAIHAIRDNSMLYLKIAF